MILQSHVREMYSKCATIKTSEEGTDGTLMLGEECELEETLPSEIEKRGRRRRGVKERKRERQRASPWRLLN